MKPKLTERSARHKALASPPIFMAETQVCWLNLSPLLSCESKRGDKYFFIID